MKILMVVSHLQIGGTETYIIALSRALRLQGIEVGIATAGGPFVSVAKGEGVTVHIIPALTQTPLQSGQALAGVVKVGKYTVVHAHDTRSFQAVNSLRRICKIPVVLTVLGSYYNQYVLKNTARIAQKVVALSPNIKNWLIKLQIPAQKILFIPNGIDTTYFKPSAQNGQFRKSLQINQNSQVVAYSSRFSADKHQIARNVILASEKLGQSNPRLVTVLVGRGIYFKQIAALAETVNKQLKRTAVIVLPSTADVRWLYYAADAVVATGRTAIEAMSCGKPIIAAGSSGYCGIISSENISTAINCNFGDHFATMPITVDRLVSDLNSVLSRPATRRSLSSWGRSLVIKHFSIENVVKLYQQVYGSV